MPPGTEREILRIAQEAIHNVKKHAAAANLYAQLEYGSDEVHVEIRDDGRGFKVSEVAPQGHYGLTGMRERAAVSNGNLKVDSSPGEGTTIRLRVPAQRETQLTMKEQP